MINSLIWALLLVSIIGPGVLAGTVAIALRSIGFVAKLLHESSVLGLVGAGGVGLQLRASVNVLAWPQVTTIVLVIFATVLISEWVSARVRHTIM